MKCNQHITFLFLLCIVFAGLACKKEPPVGPQPGGSALDTTSHNFTWTTYTFFGNTGSSGFKDVAIINDSDIWSVGTMYPTPDTMDNVAHWDGSKWELKRVPYNYQGLPLYHPISAVFALNANNVWFVGNGVEVWDGNSFSNVDAVNAVWGQYEMEKIWIGSNNNIFIVGDGGSIVHYNGSSWTKQSSGTTIDLRDVWGTPDGNVVWASGWSNDESQSILLKYNGTGWETVWSRNGTSAPPYGSFATSMWAIDSLFLASGRGVFKDTTQVIVLPWFPYRIRGTANNNIALAGDEGMIWHWSGVDWKQLNLQSNQVLYSLAISKTMIVAVGSDYNVGFGAALIYLGKRNSD